MGYDQLTADRAAKERANLLREIRDDLEILTNYQLKHVKSYIEVKYH